MLSPVLEHHRWFERPRNPNKPSKVQAPSTRPRPAAIAMFLPVRAPSLRARACPNVQTTSIKPPPDGHASNVDQLDESMMTNVSRPPHLENGFQVQFPPISGPGHRRRPPSDDHCDDDDSIRPGVRRLVRCPPPSNCNGIRDKRRSIDNPTTNCHRDPAMKTVDKDDENKTLPTMPCEALWVTAASPASTVFDAAGDIGVLLADANIVASVAWRCLTGGVGTCIMSQ
ncbi:hypothetical protein BJ912DRAFT_1055409 [Pholiota molesta]|nr:hypothetical protein BJ912DRAFT_1055409 [Pholiota molesta]